MKPLVAFLPAGLDACGMYRMFVPHLHMPGSVFLFQLYGMQPERFATHHIAMVQRLAAKQNYESMVLFKRMGMKIVYDLDDDMWSLPHYNPAAAVIKSWLPGFTFCAMRADMITVSTAHLKVMVQQQLGKKSPPIRVVENSLDFNWYAPLRPGHKKDRNGRVTVGWAGTNTHEGDVAEVFSMIPDLLKHCPEVDFEIAGVKIPKALENLGSRVRQRDFIPVAEFGMYWPSWQWDIALAPLHKNRFNLSKSNIKMIEAAAIGIPCIASKFGEYQKFCEGSDLLKRTVLAETRSDWWNKIVNLVQNVVLRRQAGEEMRRVGMERFEIRKRITEWQTVFEEVMGN